jgi:GT2 family glycosyltransferase
MNSISVVMTYWNRPQQLQVTLRSIEHYCQNKKDVEIIIIDDCSDKDKMAVNVVANSSITIPVQTIYISPGEHWWINPCIPFNMGIEVAQGDIICLQNPECVHVAGDLFGYMREHITNRNYLTFSTAITRQSDYEKYAQMLNTPSTNEVFVKKIWDLHQPLQRESWINHPEYHPKGYHFCSAMSGSNMHQLGGFNPEFADGYAFDDDEFLWRVKQSGLDVQIVDPSVGFVSHQWHQKNTKYHGGCPEWHKNKERMQVLLGNAEVKKRWG